MSVEFIGYIGTRHASEIRFAEGPVVNRDYIERSARAHEEAGFDRALVAFHSTSPESILISAHVASVTQRLGLMIAHRPGFTAPTLAARQFATLDQLTGGRVAVHIITGGDDVEQRQDGDFLTKDERYARTDEYLEVVRKVWTSDKPFDHHGRYYRVERAFSTVKSVRPPHIPIYFGGASDAAVAVAGKHADIYALWGETHVQVRELTGRVRAAAAAHGSPVRFSLSLRPILRRHRGGRVGSVPMTSWRAQKPCRKRPAPSVTRRRRIPARCASSRLRRKARGSTSGSGPRSRRAPAPKATPPRWSARRSRSLTRCATTTRSASRHSSSAASIRLKMRSTTAGS